MPIKMKTKRRLAIEKVGMQDTMPSNILGFDNMSLLFSNFVAPGHHYFYLVQGSERVFLSPNYDVVRFKDSSVFLNRITVQAKDHQFDSAFTLKEGNGDEEVFLIEHSIFSKYEQE